MKVAIEGPELGRKERWAVIRMALVRSMPVLLGYVTMGIAAGVLLAVQGNVTFAPLWAFICALAFVSGTLSFAIVPMMAMDSSSLVAVALLTIGINFRYSFYGFSMLTPWRGLKWWQKWFLIHSLTDEVYALDVACPYHNLRRYRLYCFFNHFFDMSYWVIGLTLGAILGSNLPIPSKGIEFAMVSLFLVIFSDQMRDWWKKHHV